MPGKISMFFQRWRGSYPYLVTIMSTIAGTNGAVAGYVMVDGNVEKLGALVLGNFPDKENTRLFIVDSSGQMLLSTPYYLLGESDALPESLQRFEGEAAGFSQMTLIEGEELHETAPLHDRLTACGVDSRLILLPGQKHAFIVFDDQSPNETVQKYLEMTGDILAQRGFLQ